MPTQDMIIGLYHLTTKRSVRAARAGSFSSVAEAIMAFDAGELDLQAKVRIRLDGRRARRPAAKAPEGWRAGSARRCVETTLGRALFNETLPRDYPFVDDEVDKKRLSPIVNDLAERYPKVQVAATLDALKEAGFHWATRSGVDGGHLRRRHPAAQAARSSRATRPRPPRSRASTSEGLITDDERRQELIEIWTQATNEVAKEMEANLPHDQHHLPDGVLGCPW